MAIHRPLKQLLKQVVATVKTPKALEETKAKGSIEFNKAMKGLSKTLKS